MKLNKWIIITLLSTFLIISVVTKADFIYGLGGFPMSPTCYNGNFIPNAICSTKTFNTEMNGIKISAVTRESIVPDPYNYDTIVKMCAGKSHIELAGNFLMRIVNSPALVI